MTLLKAPLTCVLPGLLLGLCLCSCSRTNAQTAPPPPAAPVAPPTEDIHPADLAADTRLDRLYSVHEVGLPVGELLQRVGSSDMPLFADRNCEALKLHLRLVKRPLRQIMNALAQLVPGAWYKSSDGKGYILRMSQMALRRRQRWWELFLQERQDLLASPTKTLQAMRARPTVPNDVHSDDGNDEKLRQMILAGPTFFNRVRFKIKALAKQASTMS